MSRKGKVPVQLPKDVKVQKSGDSIELQGPKGKLDIKIPHGIKVDESTDGLVVTRTSNVKQNRANHGTMRANQSNMIVGVTEGHKKDLEIQGIGFRAQLQGKKIVFNLGFSHPVEFEVPDDLKATVPNQTSITVEGIDKTRVGLIAAKIR